MLADSFNAKLASAALILVGATGAAAQTWPQKAITVVVSFSAGGDTDAFARLYAEKLSSRLGQPVIVENKPGAGGVIGNSFVAKAAADGYTLLYANNTLPIVQKVTQVSPALAYHSVRDFTPIVQDNKAPMFMVAAVKSGIKSVPQLVRDVKSGRALNYGSPGIGTPMNIVAEMFNRGAEVKLPQIPYKGAAPMVADLLGGHLNLVWTTPGVVINHIKSGKLVALGVAEPKRSSLLPSVPTFAEMGYGEVQLSTWMGLMGPKGLPDGVIQTLNEHMNQIIRLPEVQAKMKEMGYEPVGGAPEDFGKQVAGDEQRYEVLVKKFGIKAD